MVEVFRRLQDYEFYLFYKFITANKFAAKILCLL